MEVEKELRVCTRGFGEERYTRCPFCTRGCWSTELPEPLRLQNIRGSLADEEEMLNVMNSFC